MSLHAELSPEALERLHAQRRNSTISSVFIAILVVVLVGLILGIFLLPEIVKETPTIVTYESNVKEDTDVQQKKVQTNTDRRPSAPSSSMAKVIAANTSSPTAVPVPDVDVTTPSLDFGDGDDFGNGWGDGGNGGGFGNIPATMRKRCSKEDRLARLQESGGNPACEVAVIKALNWLKKTQNEDGSWSTKNPVAMTGFCGPRLPRPLRNPAVRGIRRFGHPRHHLPRQSSASRTMAGSPPTARSRLDPVGL